MKNNRGVIFYYVRKKINNKNILKMLNGSIN